MSKRKTRSKRWTRAEARTVLAEQERSGLSVAAYAKKHGLVGERLYRWRKQLAKTPVTSARRGGKQRRIRFAEVSGVSAGGANDRFEVTLASGRLIGVPAGFDSEDMRRLVAVLEHQAC